MFTGQQRMAAGFTLVEVMVSLVIFLFASMALLPLLVTTLKVNHENALHDQARRLASEVMAELQVVDYGRSLVPKGNPELHLLPLTFEAIIYRHEKIFAEVCAKLDIHLNGIKTKIRIVEPLEQKDEYDGLQEKYIQKNAQYYKETNIEAAQ